MNKIGHVIATIILSVFIPLMYSEVSAQQDRHQHILILYAYGYGGRGVELFSEGFFRTITDSGYSVTDVYAEYLDLQRHKDLPDYNQTLHDMIKTKYDQKKIDLIVTVQQPALYFLLDYGKDIAPDAPVITLQHRPLTEKDKKGREIVGELNQFDIKGTLEQALKIFPGTKHVMIVSGNTKPDIEMAKKTGDITESLQRNLTYEYTIGLTLDDIINRASHLHPGSIIIFTQFNSDSIGRVFLSYEVENKIVKAAKAPVFGFYDYNLRNGGIGGSVISVENSGVRAARLAIDILQGKPLAKTESYRVNENIPMYDWSQIKHWRGETTGLPGNTVFINKPPTLWEQHKIFIISVTIFILIQSFLIIMLIINILRRKQYQHNLIKSRTEFYAILNGMFDSVVFADNDRRIKLINPAFEKMFGYTADDVTGHTTEFLYADHADYIEQGNLHFNTKPDTAPGIYEMRYRKKDGSEFWAETSGTRLIDSQGKVIGMLGVNRDITERKLIEKEKEELQSRIHQIQKMECIGRLAGGVAHDFNNMLSVIIGHIDMIMEQTDPGQPHYEDLQEVFMAAKRSADLTGQLLTFARKQPIKPAVIDLNHAINRMLRMIKRLIGENIEVTINLHDDLWNIKMDLSQIDQILTNLCVNARDAMNESGQIHIGTNNVNISESDCHDKEGAVPGDYVLLTIRDNGKGMDKETLDHIFEPFFTTKGMGKGTGLGLSTVHGIIYQNNGFIDVLSENDEGSEFNIYIPRHIGEVINTHNKPANELKTLGNETIIVVEDDPSVIKMMWTILEKEGYIVIKVNSSNDLEKTINTWHDNIHMVITDIIMPGMNGKEVLTKLKTKYPAIRHLYMSGYTSDIIGNHGILSEHVNFIQKPFTRDELMKKIRMILDCPTAAHSSTPYKYLQ